MTSTNKAELLGGGLVGVPDAKVEDRVVERAAHEPLDGKVVDALGGGLCVVPVVSVVV